MQKAIVVQYYNDNKNNLSDLNQLLQEGMEGCISECYVRR